MTRDTRERQGGAGTVAAAVLRAFPLAEAVFVDFAEGRIAVGQQYLAPSAGRFPYVMGDLNDLR